MYQLLGLAARLDQLSGEVAHLTLPAAFPLSSPVQWLWSVVAQNLLRTFAWRLPGFAIASLPYLYRNFLDVKATLEDKQDRRLVRLSPPPLAVILNLAGLQRQQYTLIRLDDRPFTLFPEG